MGAFFEFEDGDIQNSVLELRTRIFASSGTYIDASTVTPFRYSIGTLSGDYGLNTEDYLSLYSDLRKRSDVGNVTNSGIKISPYVYSQYNSTVNLRNYPHSCSINLVKLRPNTEDTSDQTTKADWYNKHWQPIEYLYNKYSKLNPDIYFTGSYDYYSYYLHGCAVEFTGSTLPTLTSSFCVQFNIKPNYCYGGFGAGNDNMTVFSQKDRIVLNMVEDGALRLYVTNSYIADSPFSCDWYKWNSVTISYDDVNKKIYWYKDNTLKSTSSFNGIPIITTSSLVVGTQKIDEESEDFDYAKCFEGSIFDVRIWDRYLTQTEISGNYNRTLTGSELISNRLVHYSRFNDGPLNNLHGYAVGSGAFDYSNAHKHGKIYYKNDIPQYRWMKNDNKDFFTTKKKINSVIDSMKVLHIPSLFYGNSIITGSFRLTYSVADSIGIVSTIVDDGLGGLYLSGSYHSWDHLNPNGYIENESYQGIKWNKVGNIFYSDGFITITEPSLFHIGDMDYLTFWNKEASYDVDVLQIQFDSYTRIPVKTFNCRAKKSELNLSHNRSFSYVDNRGTEELGDDLNITYDNSKTYITSVGIYDDDYNLVAIAKLAQPIRKRDKDSIDIKLRMDL